MKHHLLMVAAVAAVPFPAVAGVTVIGSGSARTCYLAAAAPSVPLNDALRTCSAALNEWAHDPRLIVATHVNRGILRMRRGDMDGALADFSRASRLDPSEPEAHYNRGALLLRQEQAAPAAEAFTQALQHNPKLPAQAHYGRAAAYEALGNVRAAYRDFRRASELAPEWRAPRVELSRFQVVSR